MNFKIKILFLLLLFTSVGCKVNEKPYWSDIQKFKSIDQQNIPKKQGILFIGSSSFTNWKDVQEYFPNHPITNRAFGGSTLLNLIQYKNEILNPYHPKQIVIKKIQAPKYFCSGGRIISLRQVSKPPRNSLPRVTDQPFYAGYGSVPVYAADKSRS